VRAFSSLGEGMYRRASILHAGEGSEDPRARRASRKSPRRRITVTTPPLVKAAMATDSAAPASPEAPRVPLHAMANSRHPSATVEHPGAGSAQHVGLLNAQFKPLLPSCMYNSHEGGGVWVMWPGAAVLAQEPSARAHRAGLISACMQVLGPAAAAEHGPAALHAADTGSLASPGRSSGTVPPPVQQRSLHRPSGMGLNLR
jgi:hypothetical protein